jgi:hypothetical protein
VVGLFSPLTTPWWIAGGHAIELSVGHAFRPHGDIDVLLLRRDQLTAQQALPGWQWWAADPPGTLRPWARGETLPPHVHDIWCRPGPDTPWRIQVMLEESDGEDWTSRRDPRVRRPIDAIGHRTPDGIPYLAPEIQLYYTAKAQLPKHKLDFTATLPTIDDHQRRWLAAAIITTYGGDHLWLERLQRTGKEPDPGGQPRT